MNTDSVAGLSSRSIPEHRQRSLWQLISWLFWTKRFISGIHLKHLILASPESLLLLHLQQNIQRNMLLFSHQSTHLQWQDMISLKEDQTSLNCPNTGWKALHKETHASMQRAFEKCIYMCMSILRDSMAMRLCQSIVWDIHAFGQ